MYFFLLYECKQRKEEKEREASCVSPPAFLRAPQALSLSLRLAPAAFTSVAFRNAVTNTKSAVTGTIPTSIQRSGAAFGTNVARKFAGRFTSARARANVALCKQAGIFTSARAMANVALCKQAGIFTSARARANHLPISKPKASTSSIAAPFTHCSSRSPNSAGSKDTTATAVGTIFSTGRLHLKGSSSVADWFFHWCCTWGGTGGCTGRCTWCGWYGITFGIQSDLWI